MPETKVDNEGGSATTEPPDDNDFVEVDPTGRYGRYTDVLGKGAFKTVYRAFDEVDGIEVAWNQVKIDDLLQNPDDLQRLYSEVHLLKTVRHKNIIKFYNSWIDDKNKTVNIITEIFTSGTLRQYRKKHKHVDMKAVKGWARQVLQGLRYLHSHNPPIIHRDLKCDNIFVNGNHGEVKIGDLGLATIMRQAHVHSVIGTPEFMAPELYEEDYDELVDIYSFGMCLLEMVTFEYPYSECNNPAQIYRKVTSGIKPAALNKIKDPQTKAFIEKCLVAAPQRLPAKELLLDPFLQCDGYKEFTDCTQPTTSVMPGPGYKKEEILEEGGTSGNDEISSICNDVNVVPSPSSEYSSVDSDGEYQIPPGSETEKIGSSLSLASLEVRSSTSGKEFKLKGKKKDNNKISVNFRIADQEGPARNIHFHFYLDSDTSLGVANEMIEQLDLSDQDVTEIADLIDTFIAKLVPGWNPGDSADETIGVNKDPAENVPDENCLHEGDQYQTEKLLDSVATALTAEAVKIDDESSLVNQIASAESSSVECFAPIRCEGNIHGRFEEFMYNQSGSEYSPSSSIAPVSFMGEDQASQVSLNSEVTITGSVCSESENIPVGNHQCLGLSDATRTDACPASDKIENSGEHEMVIDLNQDTVGVDHAPLNGKENFGLPERSSCPFEVISHSSKGLMESVSSFSVDNEDEYEELRGQIELIERHYENELRELNRRRQLAIDEIKNIWNQKKQTASASSQSSGLFQSKQIIGHASAGDLEANMLENSGRVSLKEITTKTNNALATVCNVPGGDNLSKAVNREHLENVELFQLSSNIDYAKESGLVHNKDHRLTDLQTNSTVEVHLLESCIDLSSAKNLHTKPATAIINLGHDTGAIVKTDDHCGDLKDSHFSAKRQSRNKCFVENHICKPSEVPSGVHEQHKGIMKESLTIRQENASDPLEKSGSCGMQQKDLCGLMGRMKPRVAPASLVSDSLELRIKVTANGMIPKKDFSRTYNNVVSAPIECEVAPPLFEVVRQQNEKSAAVHGIHCSVNKSDCVIKALIAEEPFKASTKEREKCPSLRLEKSNSPPDSPGSGRGIRSGVDPALEQRRKEQLQKSIAELEAKTLEGLKHSKNGYLIGVLPKK